MDATGAVVRQIRKIHGSSWYGALALGVCWQMKRPEISMWGGGKRMVGEKGGNSVCMCVSEEGGQADGHGRAHGVYT